MKETEIAWDTGSRRGGPECASDLLLDRLALAEVEETEKTRVLAHLQVCSACTQANAGLARDRQQFVADAPIVSLASATLARASKPSVVVGWRSLLSRLVMPVGLSAGLAAALALWIVPRSSLTPSPIEATRAKSGTFALAAYVHHQELDNQGALHLGEPLHPGDRLLFRYSGSQGGYLAVVAADAQAKVSVYYPGGATAAWVDPGREVPLKTAVELDDVLGPETIVAVRCAHPIAIAEVVAAAERALQRARDRGAGAWELGRLGLPCAELKQRIVKTSLLPGR